MLVTVSNVVNTFLKRTTDLAKAVRFLSLIAGNLVKRRERSACKYCERDAPARRAAVYNQDAISFVSRPA